MRCLACRFRARSILGGAAALALAAFTLAGDVVTGPVKVKIHDEKAVVVEAVLPVDPVKTISVQSQAMGVIVRINNQIMHLGQISTTLKIDEQVIFPGQLVQQNVRLPKTAGGKERDGHMNVFAQGPIRITQTLEVVPARPAERKPGQKRKLDTVLVRYTIENKDTQPHKVGVRIFLDVYIVDNDGALFAAPNHPKKILNGVELKDKMVPEYLQLLQRPNLADPGFVAHFTYDLGKKLEMPNRVVLTSLGAGGDNWNVNVAPAGDSAMAFFWDPKEVKPGTKRELAYAYGGGIASPPENEGQFGVVLGGSFEPGKLFTIAAHVADPAPGQALTLELPDGMERVEGKDVQPVPQPTEEAPSLVMWKARVLRTGQFTIRVRSSSGVTQTKVVTISRAEK
jgi:hypothetical protein